MALKAAPEDQALLLDLQALDTKLQQLGHKASHLPEVGAVAGLVAERDALQRVLAEQSGVWEDARLELGRVESDVAVVEARAARDTERLQATSSVKDVQALEQELAALAKRQSDLEDIELAVMETVEAREAELAATRAQLDDLEARTAEAIAARDAAIGAIDGERQHVAANRSTIAAKVPAELLALYEKQRERYGVGASHLRGGVTSASGVKLNASDMNAIRVAAPDDVILCPDSNAVLVRTAESGL
jgi:predicted  nucleic acid-binding Zn-ribbon protein